MDKRCPVFSPAQKAIMFRALHESRERKQEFGFLIGKDGSFFNHCSGDKCHIELGSHPDSEGEFHTHPGLNVYPSLSDWVGVIKSKHRYLCIGGSHGYYERSWGPLVRCYVSKGSVNTPVFNEFRDKVLKGPSPWAFRTEIQDRYPIRCNYWQDGVEGSKEVKRRG